MYTRNTYKREEAQDVCGENPFRYTMPPTKHQTNILQKKSQLEYTYRLKALM